MAVKGPYEYPHYYIGLSTDTKPTEGVLVGDEFFETNTRLYYIYDGAAWQQKITASSGAFTTSTNPAVSAATTVAIIDAYSGVIILQNDGTPAAQTLGSPTITTAGKIFTVINNDTSADNEVVNGFTITPGEAQSFIWDGSAWGPIDLGITALPVPVVQGGTELTTITDHAVMVGSGTGAVTPLVVGTNGQVLIGSSNADPVFATITDGEGIDTTLGAGTLTIAAETASDTNPGVIEIATDAETIAGSDTARAITASNLKAKLGAQTDGGLLIGAGQTAAIEATAAGATTEILVGGGVGVAPVWTPATGTGAPVRQNAPNTISQSLEGAAASSTFAGTISSTGTTVTFSSAADAVLAGYDATNLLKGIGTTIIADSLTTYITSWSSATVCIVDPAPSPAWSADTITSVQQAIVVFVKSDGTVKGWMNAAGDVYFAGKEGIGTSNPSSYHNSASNLVIYESGGSGGITITTDSNLQGCLFFADGITGDQAYRGSVVYDHNIDTMTFRTAGVADRMVINSSGNVGKGTTIPRYKDTTIGIVSSLLSDDGTNYEGLTVTPTAGLITLAAVTAGAGTDNIGFAFTPTGTGGHQFTDGVVTMTEYGAGAATFDANGVISSVSDERMKDVQGQFTAGLAELLGIDPILHKYTPESGLDTENVYAGLLAQNVMKYIPQAVGKNPDGFYSLQDRPLIAALINAVKQQQKEIEKLGGAKVNPTSPQQGEEGIVLSRPKVTFVWTEISKEAALTTQEYDEQVQEEVEIVTTGKDGKEEKKTEKRPVVKEQKTRFILSGGEVKETQVPVYETVKKSRTVLRDGVRFDENTGKFFERLPGVK